MAPSKRKAEDDSNLVPSKKANKKAPSDAPVTATIKKDEEPIFPRGGGSVLTPLEHKQITIEAKRDALFEEESSSKPSKKEDKESKKRKRKSKEKEIVKHGRDDNAVRIEGLNYKVWRALTSSCCKVADQDLSALSKDRWSSARFAKSTTLKLALLSQTTSPATSLLQLYLLLSPSESRWRRRRRLRTMTMWMSRRKKMSI